MGYHQSSFISYRVYPWNLAAYAVVLSVFFFFFSVHHAVLPNALWRRSLHLEITILLFYSSFFSFPCISPRTFVPAVSSLKGTQYSVQIECVYSKGLLRACTVGFLYPGFRGTCLCILQFSQVQIKKYSESQLHLSLTLRLSFWAWFPKQYR